MRSLLSCNKKHGILFSCSNKDTVYQALALCKNLLPGPLRVVDVRCLAFVYDLSLSVMMWMMKLELVGGGWCMYRFHAFHR